MERVAAFPGIKDSAVTSVTAAGPGFVAVGYGGQGRALVWRSVNGIEWTSVPDSPVFDDASMAGVASNGERIVAVGRDLTSIDDELAAAWVSLDGLEWRRASGTGLEDAQMIDVIAGGPGFIAAGTLLAGVDAAAVWTSADGEVWTRVPQPPAFARSFIWAATAGRPGYVAGGWQRTPEPSAAFWTSSDGVTWEAAPSPPAAVGVQVRSVTDLHGTLVAVGDSVGGGQGAAWVSRDGLTWHSAVDGAEFANASVASVALLPDGLVAAGSRGIDAAMWTSRDGAAWRSLEPTASMRNAYITDMAVSAGRLVAVGAGQVQVPGTGSFEQTATAWFNGP